jgi:hypothetical protein
MIITENTIIGQSLNLAEASSVNDILGCVGVSSRCNALAREEAKDAGITANESAAGAVGAGLAGVAEAGGALVGSGGVADSEDLAGESGLVSGLDVLEDVACEDDVSGGVDVQRWSSAHLQQRPCRRRQPREHAQCCRTAAAVSKTSNTQVLLDLRSSC